MYFDTEKAARVAEADNRRAKALSLRRDGFSFSEIGEKLGGISATRARAIVQYAERCEKVANVRGAPPPAPAWAKGLIPDDLARVLEAHGFCSKEHVVTAIRNGAIGINRNGGGGTIPNLGHKGLAELTKRLGIEKPGPRPRKPASQKTIQRAIDFLTRYGYSVTKNR